MEKIIPTLLLGAAVLALSSVTIAKENKQGSKELSNATAAASHTVLTPADLKWGDPPPGLPAGAKLAVLEGDPAKKGPFTIRFQTPDGYKVAPHSHPTAERITVISGTFLLGMGTKFDEAAGREMVAGSFAVMPAGMNHFAWAKGETIVQIHGKGPFEIRYVNPADDPRNTKK